MFLLDAHDRTGQFLAFNRYSSAFLPEEHPVHHFLFHSGQVLHEIPHAAIRSFCLMFLFNKE
jgi:hypothetical protein